VNEASLTMRMSLFRSNSASSTGGVIYSLNSDLDIDTSLFDGNKAYKASFLYMVGYNGITSFIGDCYISTNEATYNTFNIVDSQVEMDETYFADNYSTGGSNGITAIGSIITATGIQAVQTFIMPDD
jgi:predicted outer membrane repeat protein